MGRAGKQSAADYLFENSGTGRPGAGRESVSLYKALLVGHVGDHLKAGKLNLAHSLRYRPSDTYLLDAATWERQREELLV